MKYKDKKWAIIYDNKEGLKIYVQCECGYTHDISLDAKGNLIGRGTEIKR